MIYDMRKDELIKFLDCCADKNSTARSLENPHGKISYEELIKKIDDCPDEAYQARVLESPPDRISCEEFRKKLWML